MITETKPSSPAVNASSSSAAASSSSSSSSPVASRGRKPPSATGAEEEEANGVQGMQGMQGWETLADHDLVVVREGEETNPAANLRSYVYVARTSAGWFYVGICLYTHTRTRAHVCVCV